MKGIGALIFPGLQQSLRKLPSLNRRMTSKVSEHFQIHRFKNQGNLLKRRRTLNQRIEAQFILNVNDWFYRLELSQSTYLYSKYRNFHSSLTAVEILLWPDNPDNLTSASFDVYRSPSNCPLANPELNQRMYL
ncbi:hypothetical protein AVEN_226682-1 [Araneus ventricosus]|uniref:Uncharacterized protein n=1 Tax=Araneus ventricosus TaxID=182803 RepID=A0A4Y2CXF8_ARAVE|nr:hypothetical protein AVEN_226682-1 [Araneus ventricosus]